MERATSNEEVNAQPPQTKRATSFTTESFAKLVLFGLFEGALTHQGCDFLRVNNTVVDADVVDQAGPEATCGQVAAHTDIQAGGRPYQAGLHVPGDFDIINVQHTVGPVPRQTHPMPVAVRDEDRGGQ